MPLYEYQCSHCGYLHEVLARPGKSPPRKCPKCGKAKLERRFSVFSSKAGASERCQSGSG